MQVECNGIILKNIDYGDRQSICHIYTEQFGKESFIVSHSLSKKKKVSTGLFQPSSIINFSTERQATKKIFRIKNPQWQYIYQASSNNVLRHCVKIFMVDLIYQTIKHPEPNEALFLFFQKIFILSDQVDKQVLNLFPIYFTYRFWRLLGHDFSLETTEQIYQQRGIEPLTLKELKQYLEELNKTEDFLHLFDLKIFGTQRRDLLEVFILHYLWVIPNFKSPPSLSIIKQVLEN